MPPGAGVVLWMMVVIVGEGTSWIDVSEHRLGPP